MTMLRFQLPAALTAAILLAGCGDGSQDPAQPGSPNPQQQTEPPCAGLDPDLGIGIEMGNCAPDFERRRGVHFVTCLEEAVQ